MRDYGIVSPRFWIGATGKSLRGDLPAQLLAVYLMTSPHSTMTGVYHCPVMYMGHETGLGEQGALEALQRLIKGGFCEYEAASETVFVIRMASFQIGESLKAGDNRVSGLRRDVDRMTESGMRKRFLEVYGEAYHLSDMAEKVSPLQAPPKPGTGAGTGTGAGKEQGAKAPLSPTGVDDDSDADGSDGQQVPQCPHAEILALFATKLPELPQPRRSLWAESKNAEALRTRWRWVMTARHESGARAGERIAETKEDGIAWFGRFFDYVRKCPLLMGERKDWRAELGWLVTKSNFAKVIQGNYEEEAA